MTYFTNYITDLSDSKVERGTRCRLPPSIDWFSLIPLLPSEKIGFISNQPIFGATIEIRHLRALTLVQSAVHHVRCSHANVAWVLLFFKETRGLFRATRPFNPTSTRRRRIDVTLSQHSG
uniref:Uncharacterized protein n=1 Tax=Heterorhabditis bacteriophora TaxID=37862 RepID=A0A1I7WSU7_HETBA